MCSMRLVLGLGVALIVVPRYSAADDKSDSRVATADKAVHQRHRKEKKSRKSKKAPTEEVKSKTSEDYKPLDGDKFPRPEVLKKR